VLTDNVMPWGEVVPAWDCWCGSGFQGNSHTVMLGEHCECRTYNLHSSFLHFQLDFVGKKVKLAITNAGHWTAIAYSFFTYLLLLVPPSFMGLPQHFHTSLQASMFAASNSVSLMPTGYGVQEIWHHELTHMNQIHETCLTSQFHSSKIDGDVTP